MAEIAGLKLIVPTSVAGTGVSVSASGKVTFTTTASVSVNGCFSATYDNYLIVARLEFLGANGADMNMALRASGTDTTTNYTSQRVSADGTNVSSARNLDRRAHAVRVSSLRHGYHAYVYGPFLTQPTAIRTVNVEPESGASLHDFAVTQSGSTSFDGFTYATSNSQNFTGSLCVYGLSQ